MKRLFLMLMAGIMFIWSGSVLAYTIDDTVKVGVGWTKKDEKSAIEWVDVIENPKNIIKSGFDTKGIDVDLSGDILTITMYTKFDGVGYVEPLDSSIGKHDTIYAADLGLDLDLDGTYEYGVKLKYVGQGDIYYSAELYKVKGWKSSYDVWENKASFQWPYGEFYPEPTSNHNAWVKIEEGEPIGRVKIDITKPGGGLFAWTLEIDKDLFGSDLGDKIGIFWATGTCANDVVEGAVVPIPTTILLLGSGLLGFGLLSRRKKVNI